MSAPTTLYRFFDERDQLLYACPFCGSSWSCWWSLDAPWLAASRPVDNLGVTL